VLEKRSDLKVKGDSLLFVRIERHCLNVRGDSIIVPSFYMMFGEDPEIRIHQLSGDRWHPFDPYPIYLMNLEPDTLFITGNIDDAVEPTTFYRGLIDKGVFKILIITHGHPIQNGIVHVSVGDETKRTELAK
jgi:hypothetical protein